MVSHTGMILSVAFNSSGSILFSGSIEGFINVWDVASGELIGQLMGHAGPVTHITVSSSDDTVVTSSRDGTVKIWNAVSMELLQTLAGHVAGVNAAVIIGDSIVSASHDHTIRVWDRSTAEERDRVTAHADSVLDIAKLWDGLICTVSRDRMVKIWHLESRQQVREMRGHGAWITNVRALPKLKQIATTDELGSLRIWDPQTGTQIRSWQRTPRSHPIWGFDASSDSRLAVAAPNVFDLEDPGKSWRLENSGSSKGSRAVAVSPDSRLVAVGHEFSDIRITDLATRATIGTLAGASKGVISCAVSIDGTLFATGHGNGRVTIRDSDANVIKELDAHTFMAYSLATSDSGSLVSGGFDGEIHSWDFSSGQRKQTFKHGGLIFSVQRPEGSPYLLSAGSSKFCLWDEESGELISETSIKDCEHLYATYMPGFDQLATAGDEKIVRLWSIDGEAISEVSMREAHAAAICCLDEDRVLVATAYGTVFQINFTEGRVEAEYAAHEDWVRRVVCSCDGKLAFTSCQDGTASLIGLESGNVLPLISDYRPISSLTVHEDSLVFIDADDQSTFTEISELEISR